MKETTKKLLEIFNAISKVPRQSGKEEKIADYLERFAQERNLEYSRDESNNVLIKKKGTKGKEDKILIIQAHTDMVCVKTEESKHDFERDLIEIIQEGDIIRAKDTSLGGDDGIGVSMMLLLLDSKEIQHPALECLFTTEEETTFGGAVNFDYDKLKGSTLLNLDHCEDNSIVVGCDGDIGIEYYLESSQERTNTPSYHISIKGLKGGNSGIYIHRVNAVILMAHILKFLQENGMIKIAKIEGGISEGDIPSSCDCIINTEIEEVQKKIEEYVKEYFLREEYPVIEVERVENEKCFSTQISENIVEEIVKLKQGVITQNKNEEMVTSGNIGKIMSSKDDVKIQYILRSSQEEELQEYKIENQKISEKYGFKMKIMYEDSIWKAQEDSEIKEKYKEAYYAVNSEYPEVKITHGGIECSVFSKRKPNLDMLHVGTIIEDFHSVKEKIYISSCEKTLDVLLKFLEIY